MSNERNSQTVQEARISDREKGLLRATFAGKEELLVLTRNILFGYELTSDEKKIAQSLFTSTELKKLLRKIFLPELERDNPISQSMDLWMTLDLSSREFSQQEQAIDARHKLVAMLEKALSRLEDINVEVGDIRNVGSLDIAGLIARNMFITHTEMQLSVIRILAKSNESAESALERLTKNSSK